MNSKLEITFVVRREDSLYARLRKNGDEIEISTKYKINKKFWRNGEPHGTAEVIVPCLDKMEEIRSRLEEIHNRFPSPVSNIKYLYQHPEEIDESPTTIMKMFGFMLKNKPNLAASTKDLYEKARNSFGEFLYDTYKVDDIYFGDIKKNVHVLQYISYMRNRGMMDSSLGQYFKMINSAINYCMEINTEDQSYFRHNPFRKMAPREDNSLKKKRSLTNHLPEDIQSKIRTVDLCHIDNYQGLDVEVWRWTVLFQLWSGFSFSDFGIKEGRDDEGIGWIDNGDLIILFRRKTGMPSVIPVYNELREAMNKLRGFGGFSVRGNLERNVDYSSEYNKYNKFIKLLKQEIGYKGKWATHTLRHTFGMNMIKKGHDVLEVQRMLGHNDVNTTTKHYVFATEEQILKKAKENMS